METTRQNKISRLIQKELSEIFLLQTKSMNGVLVSVSMTWKVQRFIKIRVGVK